MSFNNNNLYNNNFTKSTENKFESNEDKFQNYMKFKNEEQLEKSRKIKPNLKNELVLPKNNNIKFSNKIRTTIININSANRIKESKNSIDKIINLNNNSLSLTSGKKQLIITKTNHNLSSGDEIEILNCTNNINKNNIINFIGGTINNITTGYNAKLTTSTPHGLYVGNKVYISKSNTYPTIENTISNVSSIIDSTNFTINKTINTVNSTSAIYGLSNIKVNVNNHGLLSNSNVTISNISDNIKLSNNPLILNLDGTNANLIVQYTDNNYNVGDEVVISNSINSLTLGSQPIFISSTETYNNVSNIHITTGSGHDINENDLITISNARVNKVITNDGISTIGGSIINIIHSSGVVTITTGESHNLLVGNKIYLKNTNTIPNINDTELTITTVSANNSFKFNYTLRNIFSITGNYGSKIIKITYTDHIFTENDSINLSGIEDNLINNNLNNTYSVNKVDSEIIQILTSNISYISENFGGSNINIGSNYINNSNINIDLLNDNYNVIKANTSNIIISNENILVTDNRTIGGDNVILKKTNLKDNLTIDNINTIHEVSSSNTNAFIVALKSSSNIYRSTNFGGSNIYINNYYGINSQDLNKKHSVKEIIDDNNFILSLDNYSLKNKSSTCGNIGLEFDTIAGIPLNKINSKYPIDNNHLRGKYQITKIDNNKYQIDLEQIATQTISFGGNNVKNNKVFETIIGYPDIHNYKIHLDRKYENIKKIELISSEFVNSDMILKDNSFNIRQNNILKWQVINDSTVYIKELTQGNYDAVTLGSLITNELSNIKMTDGRIQKIKANVNLQTAKITIKHFIQTNLSKAFSITSGTNIIRVTHNNHNLLTGDSINISNSQNVDSILKSEINKTHIITYIDDSTYSFTINSVAVNTVLNKGGKTIIIEIGSKFKILFSEQNSPYSILGFNNINTEYKLQHIGINLIDLSGDDYFYMCSPQLGNTIKDGENVVQNIFAKILLNQGSGNILYDTYVSNPKEYFDTPLKFLENIEFILKSADNNNFTTNNFEHSFSLKIDEEITFIENTNFSSRTGRFN